VVVEARVAEPRRERERGRRDERRVRARQAHEAQVPVVVRDLQTLRRRRREARVGVVGLARDAGRRRRRREHQRALRPLRRVPRPGPGAPGRRQGVGGRRPDLRVRVEQILDELPRGRGQRVRHLDAEDAAALVAVVDGEARHEHHIKRHAQGPGVDLGVVGHGPVAQVHAGEVLGVVAVELVHVERPRARLLQLDLRREVGRRADHGVGPRPAVGRRDVLAQPEVDEFHDALAVARHQDVLGLEVPVDDVAPMHVVDGLQQLDEDGPRVGLAVVAPAQDRVEELAALDELHDQTHGVVVAEGAVEVDDVLVLERAQHVDLAPQLLDLERVAAVHAQRAEVHRLHGYPEPVGPPVGLAHDAARAPAQLLVGRRVEGVVVAERREAAARALQGRALHRERIEEPAANGGGRLRRARPGPRRRRVLDERASNESRRSRRVGAARILATTPSDAVGVDRSGLPSSAAARGRR